VLKGILYLLDYFQTYVDARLLYLKCFHINTTLIFNIKLIYETFEHQNQGLVTKKIGSYCLVLPILICVKNVM